jgi:hypothetical protein
MTLASEAARFAVSRTHLFAWPCPQDPRSAIELRALTLVAALPPDSAVP